MRILLVLLLAGCATSTKSYLPDGSMGYSIQCSGSAQSWGNCYEKAGELCGAKGYEIVAGGTDHTSAVIAGPNGMVGGSGSTRNLLVKCK